MKGGKNGGKKEKKERVIIGFDEGLNCDTGGIPSSSLRRARVTRGRRILISSDIP